MVYKTDEQLSIAKYHEIKDKIECQKDLRILEIQCYLCLKIGHIAIQCNQFQRTIKGNLKRYYKKLYN